MSPSAPARDEGLPKGKEQAASAPDRPQLEATASRKGPQAPGGAKAPGADLLRDFEAPRADKLIRPLEAGTMLIDTQKELFDFRDMQPRGFHFNPKTQELVLEPMKSEGGGSKVSHLNQAGVVGRSEDFVSGWAGMKASMTRFLKGSILIQTADGNSVDLGEGKPGRLALEMFRRNGAYPETVLRGPGVGEQRLGDLLENFEAPDPDDRFMVMKNDEFSEEIYFGDHLGSEIPKGFYTKGGVQVGSLPPIDATGRWAGPYPTLESAQARNPARLGQDLLAQTRTYDITPSGGDFLNAKTWCVHPEGDSHNVIKHVPYEVANALRDYLNGKDTSPATVVLANFILEKQGTSMAPLQPRYSSEGQVIQEICKNTNMGAEEYQEEIRARGGYQEILGDPKKQREIEDSLDFLFQNRIVDVRNALRRRGWDHAGADERGPLHLGSLKFQITGIRSPGGNNIVGYEAIIKKGAEPVVRVPDLLNQKSDDFAAWLENSVNRLPAPRVK